MNSKISKDSNLNNLNVVSINAEKINYTNPYICKIVANASQVIPFNTFTTITGMSSTQGTAFNNTLNNMYDGVNSRINIKKTGKYRISANIGNPNAQYSIDLPPQLFITLNSQKSLLTTNILNIGLYPFFNPSNLIQGETSSIFLLNENDYIELGVYQSLLEPMYLGGWNVSNPELYKNPCLATLSAELL